MKKILFLDDNKARHRAIKPHLLHDEAYNVTEAVEKLKIKQYDIVFIDHDLGGNEMVDSFGEEETGYNLAQWIVENKPEISLIVVHSLNPSGSNNIANLLKENDYFVSQVPFTKMLNSEEIIEQILNWQ